MMKLKQIFSLFILSIAPSLFAKTPAKLPIVFHEKYDISFLRLEGMLHSFDSKKYGKIYKHLTTTVGIAPDAFFTPTKVSDADLLKVHTKEYLDSLNHSSTLAHIAEVPVLGWVPNFLLQWCMLDPMRYATQGTVDAAQLALTHGWAINISGGYHHAKAGNGEGFCIYADIPLACKIILEQHPDYKILIIDLDAHQGNGHEMVCGPDRRISIMDVYNAHLYPNDLEAKKYITFDYPVSSGIRDAQYLALLEAALPAAIKQIQPNLIIYNAGTDIFKEDPLGRMSISEQGIIARDAFVFTLAQQAKIPVAMVLSGGYTSQSASIIGKSIENLIKNVVNKKEATQKTLYDVVSSIAYDVTPLMRAAEKGDLDLVKKLISSGYDVNVIDFFEQPHGGTTVLGYALLGGSAQIINELIKAGANPNGVINRGVFIGQEVAVRIIPLLTYAISQNMNIGIITMLLDAGADVNATCTIGYNQTTSLIVAAASGQEKIVRLLLAQQADKNHKNCFNKTALDYAREFGHQAVIDLLLQHPTRILRDALRAPQDERVSSCARGEELQSSVSNHTSE